MTSWLGAAPSSSSWTAVVRASAHWEPGPDTWLTNSVLAERLEQDVMVDEFRYVHGIGWLAGWLEFNGRRWVETGEGRVVECVRTHTRELLVEASESGAGPQRQNELAKLQYAERIRAVAGVGLLSAGNIYRWVMCDPPPRMGDLRMDVDRAASAAGACAGPDERLPARRCCR